MRTLKAMWFTWQHGLWLALAYALCIAAAAIATGLIVLVPILILEALGYRIDEDAVMIALAVVWVPYGFGLASRTINADRLKPEGYIEPEGHYARLARKVKEQG